MAEYRELSSERDFEQACDLQRQVFGFSDLDLVSPLQLRLVARKNPPMGLHLGAFVEGPDGSQLVGVMLGFATFEEGSVYTVLLGVLPEYQDGVYGYRLLLRFRELALERGLRTMYGVYDALDAGLARLYNGGVGFVGTEFLGGKILFRWDLASKHTLAKLSRQKPSTDQTPRDALPLACSGEFPEDDEVCYEISAIREDEAREVLTEYLNRRRYAIVDCVSTRTPGGRTSFYVLRKSWGDGVV